MRRTSSRRTHASQHLRKLLGPPQRWVICGLALVLATTAGFAAETEAPSRKTSENPDLHPEDLLKLEISTTETAGRYTQKTTEAPASVSIITADEVKKYGYRTLADILRSVPSLHVSYDRQYSYLGIRGFNRGDFNSRLLVLVDGHRMNNSLSDGAFIGTEFILDVDLIEKVEVVRGPGSSLYGNNAFFGVVNVITRKAGRDLSGAEVSGEAASFDTYKGRASYGKKFKNEFEMLLSGSWYDSEGPDNLVFKEFNTGAVHQVHEVDGDAYRSVFGSLGFHDFTLEGAFNHREKVIPTAPFHADGIKFGDPRTRSTDERSFVNLKFSHDFPQAIDNVTAHVYYDRYDSTADFLRETPSVPPEVLNRQVTGAEWWGAELQLKKVFLDRHVFVAGAEYRDDFTQRLRIFDVSPPLTYRNTLTDTYNYGIYLQGDAAVRTNLHVNAGFRYDLYGHTEPTVNPRLAIIYTPVGTTTFKLIRGHAFRAPNFYERFYNGSLIPERITSHELVYEQGIGNNLLSSVSGFYNQIDHLINYNPQSNPNYQNGEGANSTGLELGLQGFFASGLRGRMSYTLQDTEFHQAGVRRSDSPKHLGKFNLIAPLVKEKVFASLEFQYTSKRLTLQGTEASGFDTVNLTLFTQNLVKGLEISGTVYNLLDRHYGDPSTPFLPEDVIQRDGRTFRVKLTYRF